MCLDNQEEKKQDFEGLKPTRDILDQIFKKIKQDTISDAYTGSIMVVVCKGESEMVGMRIRRGRSYWDQ